MQATRKVPENEAKQLLSQAREAVALGPKPLSKRTGFKKHFMSGVLALAVLATATSYGVNSINQTSALAQNSHFSGQTEQVQARIVGKVRYLGGAELEARPGVVSHETKVWQGSEDAPNASHQLILDIGEETPVTVAVSSELYAQYCQKVDQQGVMFNTRHNPNEFFANCGIDYVISEVEERDQTPVKIDTVDITFTRSNDTGQIHVTQFGEHTKVATSVKDLLLMKHKFEKTSEQAPTYRANTTPRG